MSVQNLQTVRRRIRSVQNTQKVTRAMQMVAGAKLRRSQGERVAFRPYLERIQQIERRFLEAHPDFQHPFLSKPAPADGAVPRTGPEAPAGLVVISSDTGLCGAYNERVLALAIGFLRENPSAKVVAIGKRGSRFLSRRRIARERELLDWGGRLQRSQAEQLFRWMDGAYRAGEVSSWWVAATRFVSALRWNAALERLLPIEPAAAGSWPERVLVEPDVPAVGSELLERAAVCRLQGLLLEAFTSEHSARMIAMRNATENASEVIDQLTLARNKARQAAITKELIEVVSGAQALG